MGQLSEHHQPIARPAGHRPVGSYPRAGVARPRAFYHQGTAPFSGNPAITGNFSQDWARFNASQPPSANRFSGNTPANSYGQMTGHRSPYGHRSKMSDQEAAHVAAYLRQQAAIASAQGELAQSQFSSQQNQPKSWWDRITGIFN